MCGCDLTRTPGRWQVARKALAVLVATAAIAAPCHAKSPGETLPADAHAVVAFSPGQALRAVVDTIEGARSTILVAAYTFNSRPVASALLAARRRGVSVSLVVDAAELAKGYSAARFLANQGVPVRANGRYAIQHNKFMVIDGTTVQTGSFNYTAAAASRNAENVLVLSNMPSLAQAYTVEWRRLWNESTGVVPSY